METSRRLLPQFPVIAKLKLTHLEGEPGNLIVINMSDLYKFGIDSKRFVDYEGLLIHILESLGNTKHRYPTCPLF